MRSDITVIVTAPKTPKAAPGDPAACRNTRRPSELRIRGCSGPLTVKGIDFAAAKPPLL
jgi:hypothetical protein